ncbi:MAG: FAD-dependent oxidoreductase [Myxococcales bacterium]|nr:MAG: FAD-dependent oxidoreductase [Myxococcales bacterium]
MARTRLFGQLRRIAARALASRPPQMGDVPSAGGRWTRRQVTWGVAPLAAASLLPGCGSDDAPSQPAGERVAIVGAGLAGLHCAYRLQQSGLSVSVLEAASRVGGRTFTAREDAYGGQTFELGGELIDSNHRTMLALAEELGITVDDRFEEGIQTDVWFVDGAEVSEATITSQFTAVAGLMAEAMAAADDPENETAFAELDETPLFDWLEQSVPSAEYPELNSVLNVAYRGEFGLETSEQSALNLIYLIGSDEPEPFRIFGESDERYHAREGSDAFATRLADKLEDGALSLNTKLTRVSSGAEGGLTLEVVSTKSGEKRELTFDYVVLALPFSVLRKVRIEAPISETKQQIIDELGYGTNAKVMGQFEARVWREEHQKSGSATTDLPLQQTWDSSIGQPGERGILTNFLGGQAGVDVGEGEPEDYYTGLLSDIDRLFPGAADSYRAGSARRMHWPSYEYTLGSYTCYRPGQWENWGLEGEREGNLMFCGEHTSMEFQGWMEGAAESGARVAGELLKELKLARSAELDSLLGTESNAARGLSRGGVPATRFPRRQRAVLERSAARVRR